VAPSRAAAPLEENDGELEALQRQPRGAWEDDELDDLLVDAGAAEAGPTAAPVRAAARVLESDDDWDNNAGASRVQERPEASQRHEGGGSSGRKRAADEMHAPLPNSCASQAPALHLNLETEPNQRLCLALDSAPQSEPTG